MMHKKISTKAIGLFTLLISTFFTFCTQTEQTADEATEKSPIEKRFEPISIDPDELEVVKDLLYDNHTLADTYPYKDTTRVFQWNKIREMLAFVDSIQQVPNKWGILQNYKNTKGEAPLVETFIRNEYQRVSDTLGVERYQSVPLYTPTDSLLAIRYGRDGSLVKILENDSNYIKVATMYFDGEWRVPNKYVKTIADTVIFKHIIFIDRTNQNISSLEKNEDKWLIRSMNPTTTGLKRPPYMQETPLGLFVVQEKKYKMFFVVDGTHEIGGFAPHANRFSNGGHIHGIPVNLPRTEPIEFSYSLGTTPRSHMCVRTATSHAKFLFDWAPLNATLVFVFD